MEVRHEYHGRAPVDMKAGHTYAVTLTSVTTESDMVVFHWDFSSATEVVDPPEEKPTLEGLMLAAFRDLKQAGPGAICEECGHFAGRHQEEAARKCWFWENSGMRNTPHPPCECTGFVWQGFRFSMDSRSGPLFVKEKV